MRLSDSKQDLDMASPVYNPVLPYIGIIDGGFTPGKLVRIQGNTHHSANRFAINLQCGPNTSPRDDIALHISPRFCEHHITRNSLQNMSWGVEENHGHMPLTAGQSFEIIILCDPSHYKIAVNGQHFAEFGHRIPFQRVSFLTIDGDVNISLIQYEGGSYMPGSSANFVPPPVAPVPPLPMSTGVPYPPNSSVFPPVPGSYGPMPPGSYAQGYPTGYYPPPPPGYAPHTSSSKGGLLDKAGAAIAGALGTTGIMGALGGKSHHGSKAAMGAGLTGAAATGHLSPKKAHKAQKKAHKKALKYGLPIAGVGLGAYALHKGFHHHHHGSSSSSSSSSSSEEE
ncbi:hypothetical protein L9F63_003278 [Diploptera punctata]|uniref:Galectin n=1 Tax=Diploptera punctata TaxID=6984 RepID=A0AAD8E9K7_DIPPU|nr:hypothetical protein L9F63_003278 [Diploptera punctata]